MPSMKKISRRSSPTQGRDLISLAQQLARDAERHAILSASLASQADRLMVAGMHLDFPGFGHVTRAGSGYTFIPEVWTPTV